MDAKVIGNLILKNSEVKCAKDSSNNVIYCDNTFGDVVLENSTISFNGSNSLIYIVGGNKKSLKIKATLNTDTMIYIGRNSSFHKTATVHLATSEGTNIIIGDNNMFSRDIWIRTGDAHPVFSTKDKKRLNYPKDVIVGDHIWIGQDSMILKGSIIGSGSIIGAKSLCSGKTYYSNSSYGGSPARIISEEGSIFFDKTDLNSADKEQIKKFDKFDDDKFIYQYDKEKFIVPSIIDFLKDNKNVDDRIKFFTNISKDKNRFAISSNYKLAGEIKSSYIYSF